MWNFFGKMFYVYTIWSVCMHLAQHNDCLLFDSFSTLVQPPSLTLHALDEFSTAHHCSQCSYIRNGRDGVSECGYLNAFKLYSVKYHIQRNQSSIFFESAYVTQDTKNRCETLKNIGKIYVNQEIILHILYILCVSYIFKHNEINKHHTQNEDINSTVENQK